LNVKYAKTKIPAETGICLGVICWRVSSREDIERWQQQRWQCDANSAKNEKSESIYQEGFSQRRWNAYHGMGAEYVALPAHDEFQLPGRTDPRPKTALYGFYTELKEHFAV